MERITMSKKIFDFGKIDYNGTGRKINKVTIEVKFDGEKFSACANVWNLKQTDIIAFGQMLDKLYKFFKHNQTFKDIYFIWKNYHLNDLTAGTFNQMAYLKTLKRPSNAEFYTWECEQLEKAGLLYDLYEGEPYKYGTRWLTNPIPENVKSKLSNLLQAA